MITLFERYKLIHFMFRIRLKPVIIVYLYLSIMFFKLIKYLHQYEIYNFRYFKYKFYIENSKY